MMLLAMVATLAAAAPAVDPIDSDSELPLSDDIAAAPPSAADVIDAATSRRGVALDGARRLSLEECIRTALEENRQIQVAEAQVDEAVATRKIARGRFGPTVSVDANVQVWDKEIAVDFGGPMIPGMEDAPSALVVQDQVTAMFRTTVAQPLTGMWGISEAYRVRKKAQTVASLEVQREREAVALDIATAYYEALKAERLAEVALVSVDAIAANRERAEAFHAAGVMGRDQLLEADVRLAEAQSMFIRARGHTRIARANLAFVMGLPVDSDIAPQPLRRAALPRVDRDLDAVAGRAMERRTEVASASLRIEQAKHARRAATSNMLPQLSALASYQRTEGQAFARTNQFFVGLNLQWNIWEWGAKYYQVPEAKAQERQAQLAQVQVHEGIRLELHRALIELEVSEQQLEATEVAVEQAAENLRIVQLRFDAAAASATEVLDSVARRARAEAEQANAYYAHLQAIATYRHGLGELAENHQTEERR
jgi:outer membrane protein